MCLILLGINTSPKFKLILAANRDEFYSRSAEKAHLWKENIVGGKDLKAGGMWLGVSAGGRIAAVTNYRSGLNESSKKSRGMLVKNFISSDQSEINFLKSLQEDASGYNGFNLICGTPGGLFFYSNTENKAIKIPDGFHGLSNASLDTPWPKVTVSVKEFEKVLKKEVFDPENIFSMMLNRAEFDEHLLPDTGIGKELEKKLSPLFINMPGYGTRCTSVITVDSENYMEFRERSYGENGEVTDDVFIQLQMDIKKPVR